MEWKATDALCGQQEQLSLDDLLRIHDVQLQNSSIPKFYWDSLLKKVQNEIFDAGEWFSIETLTVENKLQDPDLPYNKPPRVESLNIGTSAQQSGSKHSIDIEDVSEKHHAEVEETESITTEEPDDETTDLFESKDDGRECPLWHVRVHGNSGISTTDPEQIFLISHSWTFYANQAKKDLWDRPQLLERMASLMNIKSCEYSRQQLINEICTKMWSYNHFYRVRTATQPQVSKPIWYIMDEFGSRIQHSNKPSFNIVPFHFIPTGTVYSVMWPLQDLQHGDEVTWDYISPSGRLIIDDTMRDILLMPWHANLPRLAVSEEREIDFVMESEVDTLLQGITKMQLSNNEPQHLSVYTDIPEVKKALSSREHFQISDTLVGANVIWIKNHEQITARNVSNQFINHILHEHILTDKSLLALVSTRGSQMMQGQLPSWLQQTYSLMKHLSQFVYHFLQDFQDSSWIIKQCEAGASTDCIITSNLPCILRQAVTGPKVACMYERQPVLCDVPGFPMVKFTLEFLVLVRSVQPLQLFVHDSFALKLAKRPFKFDFFDEEDIHLTRHISSNNISPEYFEKYFEEHYLGIKWTQVKENVYSCLKDLFITVTTSRPPVGLGHLPNGRSVFGVEVLLKWVTRQNGESYMQPVILSCESCPSFLPFMKNCPEIINDVFYTLFKDPTTVVHTKQLI